MENEYADIRYVFIDGIKAGQKYGFIAETDNGPILLSDPYAKAISEPLDYITPYTNEKSFAMAKCVVVDDTFDWQDVEKPRISREDTVLLKRM